ncbi:MAG: hypothetical protein AAF830_03355 [Pseudomonadota bacterium]
MTRTALAIAALALGTCLLAFAVFLVLVTMSGSVENQLTGLAWLRKAIWYLIGPTFITVAASFWGGIALSAGGIASLIRG